MRRADCQGVGAKYSTVMGRMNRRGETFEEAIKEHYRSPGRLQLNSLSRRCRAAGWPGNPETIRRRMTRFHITFEEAVKIPLQDKPFAPLKLRKRGESAHPRSIGIAKDF